MRGRMLRKWCLYLPAPAAFILLLIKAEKAAAAAGAGVEVCIRSVIPALFPALVLSSLLIRIGFPPRLLHGPGAVFERLFRIRRTALTVFLTGLVGGYPLGAEAAAECCRLGGCSEEEAGRLLVFANNCSPAFLFGLLGSRDAEGWRQALLLLAIQWAVSFWLGVLLGIGHVPSKQRDLPEPADPPSFPALFTFSVRAGCRSVMMICAYVVFFGVMSAFLPEIPLLRGFFELTGGVRLLNTGTNDLISAAFLIGWGGLSVACQVMSAMEGSGIPAGIYLPARLLHGGVMAFSVWLFRLGPVFLLPWAMLLTGTIFVKKGRILRHADL